MTTNDLCPTCGTSLELDDYDQPSCYDCGFTKAPPEPEPEPTTKPINNPNEFRMALARLQQGLGKHHLQ